MTFNERVQRVYSSIFKRLKRYVIPILLVLSFVTATTALDTRNNQLLNRLELLNMHYTSGLLIFVTLLVLLYHRVYIGVENLGELHSRPLRKLINRIFFSCLTLLTLSGGITFIATKELIPWLPHQNYLLFSHHLFLWVFLPIFMVKLYLDTSAWVSQLYWYLREF
ncbi:MAG: hypothetical protein QNL04_04800 [SAR324 cluster bacterium]|nr:hypothetical protein [SAR324 cluster bacterium]